MKSLQSLFLTLLFGSFIIFSFSSCEKETPEPPNEEELITTLTLTLTPVGSGLATTFTFEDLDGDGGNDPVITEGRLSSGLTYNAYLEISNGQTTPPTDITQEVLLEAEEHQFFYESTVNGLSIEYRDEDADQNPIGLQTLFTAGDPTTGTLTITLRHQPDKAAAGVADGDITNAGGETDIQVTFNVEVQ